MCVQGKKKLREQGEKERAEVIVKKMSRRANREKEKVFSSYHTYAIGLSDGIDFTGDGLREQGEKERAEVIVKNVAQG